MAPTNGWIELVLIEARDLVAADLRGTSDPYVRVQYGKLKKRTKVSFKFHIIKSKLVSFLGQLVEKEMVNFLAGHVQNSKSPMESSFGVS